MTIQEYRKALADAGQDGIDLVIEVYNCRTAEITPDGAIWIEGPQSGHYLSDEDILPLMAREQIAVTQ